MPFVWIIRTWCSVDTFWEAVRSSKDYDVAYWKPEQVLEEMEKIVLKEQKEWKDLHDHQKDNDFLVELPTVDQIKSRPFYKFLTITNHSSKEQVVQNWYIERLHKD